MIYDNTTFRASSLKLEEKLKLLPTRPGVYLMKDKLGRIIYVGKAKSLKARVRSYFQNQKQLPPRTRLLVTKICDLEVTVTNTELEALLLECNLIKKHRPRYNVRLKDDKNYPYVVLDFTHRYPQFRIERRISFSPKLKYFGPFSAGVNEIARFLLKTFQIRDCSDLKFKNRARPCLNYEIGTCTAPCVGYVNEADYAKQIHQAVLFLKGKKTLLLKSLKDEMNDAAKKQEYEFAAQLRDKIVTLSKMTEKQSAILSDTQKNIDVIGCLEREGEICWVVLFIRSGMLTGRRSQKTTLGFGSVEDATRTFLEQFYSVSLTPDEIWMASEFSDRKTVEEWLSVQAKAQVKIRLPRSEKPLRLLSMAYENAKLLMHESMKSAQESALKRLEKILDLRDCPHSIEGIDVSNLQGGNPTVSVVHFADERPLKSRYRLYYPKTVEGQNDFAMIYEVCLRRFGKEKDPPPDLLLIDGGIGQLQSAVKALGELKVSVPVISLAKARTDSSFTLKEVERTKERIFIPNRKNPILLDSNDPALRLLMRVRDESHRFAIKSHRSRRAKAIGESTLLQIPGIGENMRQKLLVAFKEIDKVKNASIDELSKCVGQSAAHKIYSYFHNQSEED